MKGHWCASLTPSFLLLRKLETMFAQSLWEKQRWLLRGNKEAALTPKQSTEETERERKKRKKTQHGRNMGSVRFCVCVWLGDKKAPGKRNIQYRAKESKTVSAAHFTVNYNGFNLVQQKRASGLSLRPAAITGISVRKLGHISLYLNLHACLSSNDSLQGLMDS